MNLLPNQGGVQQSTYKLYNLFKKQGHLVNVCSFSTGVGSSDSLNRECEVTYLGDKTEVTFKLLQLFSKFNPDVCINQVGYSLDIIKCLRKAGGQEMKLVNTIRINPLNFVENIDGFLARYFHKSLLKILPKNILRKVVLLHHKRKQSREYGSMLRLTDALVFLSPSFIDELKFFNVNLDRNRGKLFSIPNPFIYENEFDKANIFSKEKIILFVGRLNILQKRVDLLLEIWNELHDRLPDWKFEVVGDGPEKNRMIHYCQANNLDRVTFYGFDNPKNYYKKASLLHFTSAYEGFGNVLVEAQIEATPAILFDSYAAASDIVVNGRNGYLIKPFDLDDFIDKTIYLCSNQDVLLELSDKAQADSQKFSTERIAAKWDRLFENLLEF